MSAGWIRTKIRAFDSTGELIVAEFCLEGPAVVEVSALLSVIPTNTMTTLSIFVDEGGVLSEDAVTKQVSEDDEGNDILGVYWMGAIS